MHLLSAVGSAAGARHERVAASVREMRVVDDLAPTQLLCVVVTSGLVARQNGFLLYGGDVAMGSRR